jgi:hypothetical protein
MDDSFSSFSLQEHTQIEKQSPLSSENITKKRQRRKNVSFDNTKYYYFSQSEDELSADERSKLYMNKQEYQMARLNALQMIQKSNYGVLTDQDGEDPVRGLEAHTLEFKKTIITRRQRAITAVLIKQREGYSDERIAMAYREIAKEGSEIAYQRGLSDQGKAWPDDGTERTVHAPPGQIMLR